jgi:hypothetical protein
MSSLYRADGETLGEHALNLTAKAGEFLTDSFRLVYVGSTSVWRSPSGGVEVVTLETETDA